MKIFGAQQMLVSAVQAARETSDDILTKPYTELNPTPHSALTKVLQIQTSGGVAATAAEMEALKAAPCLAMRHDRVSKTALSCRSSGESLRIDCWLLFAVAE